jgi:hypothetical protein
MKRLFAMLLLLLMFLPILGKTGVWLWFEANQDWIAKTLCINKDNEKANACKGCCYLDKQLKKVEEPSNANAPSKENKKQGIEEWVYDAIPPKNIVTTSFGYTFNFSVNEHILDGYHSRLVKPPCFG